VNAIKRLAANSVRWFVIYRDPVAALKFPTEYWPSIFGGLDARILRQANHAWFDLPSKKTRPCGRSSQLLRRII
jgi:hypothetical protein